MTKSTTNPPPPDNTLPTGKRKRGGKTRTSWKPGQSGNPKGAPKRGESWAELIKLYGEMTPEEIAEKAKTIAGQLKKIGGGISMKEAVIIRVFAALMFEPTKGLWDSLMERTDGKVPQPVTGTGEDGAIEIGVRLIDYRNGIAAIAGRPAGNRIASGEDENTGDG